MQKNIDFFDYSLQHKEPLIDNFYMHDVALIIPKDADSENELQKSLISLYELVTTYKVLKRNNTLESVPKNEILMNIHDLLNNKNMNYSEFVSFWSVIDVSHSIYKCLSLSDRMLFIEKALDRYIDLRHETYTSHGYTSVAIQATKDSKAHKANGSSGLNKLRFILEELGYSEFVGKDIDTFEQSDKVFIFTDKKGKPLFKNFLKKHSIQFEWGKQAENKMPDCLIKLGKRIIIVEHKHMKESGGGQDKQVNEVIKFINYSEKISEFLINYVTFLDGLYFNLFINANGQIESKINSQITSIVTALSENPSNFFVNTAGFRKLMESVSGDTKQLDRIKKVFRGQ